LSLCDVFWNAIYTAHLVAPWFSTFRLSRKASGYFVILGYYLCPTEYSSERTVDSARYGGREGLHDKPRLLPKILCRCSCPQITVLYVVFVLDPRTSAMLRCSSLDTPWAYFFHFHASPTSLFPQTRLPASLPTWLFHSLAQKGPVSEAFNKGLRYAERVVIVVTKFVKAQGRVICVTRSTPCSHMTTRRFT
jgi:hypothetical protein